MQANEQMIIGKNFLHVFDYVRHKRGIQGVEQLKKHYNLGLTEILEGKFYPFEDYVRLLRCVQEIFEDNDIAYKIGLHRATTLLLAKGIKNSSFEVLEKVASAWEGFNNFGSVKVIRDEDGRFSILISKYSSNPLFCQRMRGFFHGLVNGNNGDSFTVREVNCVLDGKKYCEFVFQMK